MAQLRKPSDHSSSFSDELVPREISVSYVVALVHASRLTVSEDDLVPSFFGWEVGLRIDQEATWKELKEAILSFGVG
jgi:hypothetical protein